MTQTQPTVLAGSLGDCCIKGVKHFGEPNGEIILIAGIETYISKPPPSPPQDHSSHDNLDKKIILYFADAFGPFYINAQLLQDYFASHGLFSQLDSLP